MSDTLFICDHKYYSLFRKQNSIAIFIACYDILIDGYKANTHIINLNIEGAN